MDIKNVKHLGEIGERITIGILSQFGMDIMLPMTDNLSFDLVIWYNNKFYKCQVKTTMGKTPTGAYRFGLTSNNWYSKTEYVYQKGDYDVLICCNMSDIFLFKFEEVEGKSNLYLRDTPTKSGQKKGIWFTWDYKISKERIEKVFD